MHVAIIMDGNGRWATRRGKPRIYGHQVGSENVDRIIRACPELGVDYLSLFAFSTENWTRPREEVRFLLNLFMRKITEKTPEMKKNGVRVRFLGDRSAFPQRMQDLMAYAEEETASCKKINLFLCLNYGSRDEIVRAVRAIGEEIQKGNISPSELTEEVFANYLDTRGIPPPDLVIRTGGEKRLSNFLLFQSAYAELYFTRVLWPDFSAVELRKALSEFKRRKRRFGSLG